MNPPTEKNHAYESWRWKIFAITWLGYAGFYLTRKSFSVAKIGLADEFGFSNTQLGYYDNAYLWAYMVGQFLWGVSGDKFGPRKIVMAGMLCSCLVGFVSGLTSAILVFAAFGIAQGLCQSTGWPNLVKNMSSWFSQRERGVVMGWWCTNYAIGGLVASPFAGWAAEQMGTWRWAFFAPALALFGIFLLFAFFQRNHPEDVGLPPIEEYHGEPALVLEEDETPDEEPEGSWKVIGEVLSHPTVWVMAIVYFCLKPTRYAILFWGPKYVNEASGSGMAESALVSAMFELAGPLGVLFAGVVSDKIFKSRRMPIAVIMLGVLAIVLFYFNGLAKGQTSIGVLLFLIGFLLYGPDSLLSGTAAMDFGTKKGAATAAGFINGLGSLGAAIGGGMAGWVSDHYGWDALFNTFAGMTILAALLLAPFWNATPATSRGGKKSSP
ncbi:MAG: MFS transporter [Candidatus Omnitrophica bacterium]|nr:MFS transporter [Candidatus Omnitrophota bacterium]